MPIDNYLTALGILIGGLAVYLLLSGVSISLRVRSKPAGQVASSKKPTLFLVLGSLAALGAAVLLRLGA